VTPPSVAHPRVADAAYGQSACVVTKGMTLLWFALAAAVVAADELLASEKSTAQDVPWAGAAEGLGSVLATAFAPGKDNAIGAEGGKSRSRAPLRASRSGEWESPEPQVGWSACSAAWRWRARIRVSRCQRISRMTVMIREDVLSVLTGLTRAGKWRET
jgi:hypothetical protein